MIKSRLLIATSAISLLFGAGCSPDTQLMGQRSVAPQENTASSDQASKRQTDPKTGISFIIPKQWILSADEGGNAMLLKEKPYSTVVFEKLTDKKSWETRLNDLKGINSDDKLIKNERTTLGAFPTTHLVFQRYTGKNPKTGQEVSFQYAEYFIDAGTKFYLISTSDPSPEIDQIIQSVGF